MRELYLDHAVTTRMVNPAALAMVTFLQEEYGLPDQPHLLGLAAAGAVRRAREAVATLIGADHPENVQFTNSGSEANRLALRDTKASFVVSAIEHVSVQLAAQPSAAVVPVGPDGKLDLKALEQELKQTPSGTYSLVAVQLASPVTGVTQDIKAVSGLCSKYRAKLHCDACMAAGRMAFDVEDLGVDTCSLSAHKLGGPKGVGALWAKGLVEPDTTNNVPAMVGFGAAAQLAAAVLSREERQQRAITRRLAELAVARCPEGVRLLSPTEGGLPGIICFRLAGATPKLFSLLAEEGVCLSAPDRSPLLAMGLSPEEASEVVTISLGIDTTKQEASRGLEAILRLSRQPAK